MKEVELCMECHEVTVYPSYAKATTETTMTHAKLTGHITMLSPWYETKEAYWNGERTAESYEEETR